MWAGSSHGNGVLASPITFPASLLGHSTPFSTFLVVVAVEGVEHGPFWELVGGGSSSVFPSHTKLKGQ